MSLKNKLAYLVGLAVVLGCGTFFNTDVVSASDTPYQSITGNNQNNQDKQNNSNDNGNDDDEGNRSGDISGTGDGNEGGYLPSGTGASGLTPGSTTTGTTAGATATNGVGAGTTATSPQNVSDYGSSSRIKNTVRTGSNGIGSATSSNTAREASKNGLGPNQTKDNNGLKNKIDSNAVRLKEPNMAQRHLQARDYSNHVSTSVSMSREVKAHGSVHHKRANPSLRRGLQYVRKHVHHYNHKYPRWHDDCTNFASQYMVARGYRKTKRGNRHLWLIGKGTCHDSNKWYCNKKGKKYHYNHYKIAGVSETWPSVKSFWNYWTKHRHLKHFSTRKQSTVVHHAHVGDILQFMSKKEGYFHTAIITKKTKHEVYYSCHTGDYYNKPLRDCNKGRYRRGANKIIGYRVIHVGKRKI